MHPCVKIGEFLEKDPRKEKNMKKYAIIGFGGLGKLHLANLIELERERGDIKLVAICGADPKSFKQNVKINLGTVDIGSFDFDSCNFYVDYKELIDKETPDFIVSAVPTYLHEEVASYALMRGVHVFSEKPIFTQYFYDGMLGYFSRIGQRFRKACKCGDPFGKARAIA